jgi:hypothetical protein
MRRVVFVANTRGWAETSGKIIERTALNAPPRTEILSFDLGGLIRTKPTGHELDWLPKT